MKVTIAGTNRPIKVSPVDTNKTSTIQPVDERLVKLINGHSPIVSDRDTWLVYNDETQQYEDTNITVRTGDEIDPTVPLWAKEQTKPTYTPTEIGAVDSSDVLTLEEIEVMFGVKTK